MTDPSATLRDLEPKTLICVDFDKTLTTPDDEWGPAHAQTPDLEMVALIRRAYYNGAHVVVWTARQWSEASHVAGWLTAHEVPHHGLQCGKGGGDVYIDDKIVSPEAAKELLS